MGTWLSAVERLASILIDQNKMAKESWSKIKESSMTTVSAITNYLHELFSLFSEQIELLKRFSLQVVDGREKIKNIIQNFEKVSVDILNESENPIFQLQALLQNLLDAEELRTDLYRASLRISALKKEGQIAKEYVGVFDVAVDLKPADRILSGRVIQARMKVKNLSSMLQRIRVYVAWFHPAQIPFKFKEEEITLAPLGSTIKVYTHNPKATGKHIVRITLYKEKEEVASLSKTFEVLRSEAV